MMKTVESITDFLSLGIDGMKALQIDITILSEQLDEEKKQSSIKDIELQKKD